MLCVEAYFKLSRTWAASLFPAFTASLNLIISLSLERIFWAIFYTTVELYIGISPRNFLPLTSDILALSNILDSSKDLLSCLT